MTQNRRLWLMHEKSQRGTVLLLSFTRQATPMWLILILVYLALVVALAYAQETDALIAACWLLLLCVLAAVSVMLAVAGAFVLYHVGNMTLS